MKLLIVFITFVWLLCGFVGAWWQDGIRDLHIKAVAKGPITLVHAFNENPVTYPGPT